MEQQASRTASPPTQAGFLARVWRSRFVAALLAGFVSGTLVVTFDISLAAIIFTGPLGNRLPLGIGIFLISSVVVGAIVTFGSSFRAVIAAPQEDTSIILASMAGVISLNVREIDPTGDPFPTVVAAIAVTSAVTGAFFLILGLVRGGILVRFIPYPVVGGFLAGCGWLLIQGAVTVMVGEPVGFENAALLLTTPGLTKCIPGLIFGVLLTGALRRYNKFGMLPAMLVVSIGLFYALVSVSGSSLKQAMDAGWLIGPFPEGALWPPLRPAEIQAVHWSLIGRSAFDIAAVSLLATITILLSASGVELATEEEIDLDRELRVTGLANLFGALGGGVVGYMSLPESSMNHKSGGPTRVAGIVAVSLSALVLVIGAESISYVPRPVLGGLVAFLGLSFLLETIYEGWFRLRRGEYLIVVVILLVIALAGFLRGVAVGLAVSLVLFAVSYSRIEVIRNAISGSNLRSNVGRKASEEKVLDMRGPQIYILQLQGFIFFGTAYGLLDRAQQRILDATPMPVRYLVLDFRHVNGLDSSAVASFQRLRRIAETHDVMLMLTEVPPDIRNSLARGGVVVEGDKVCRVFSDLDHGLEACENELIVEAPPTTIPPPVLSRDLAVVFNGPMEVVRFLGYLDRVELPAGYDLFRQGDDSKDLYLIESGELTAWIMLAGNRTKRLRTMGPGTVVGESGLYLDAKRSATVTANDAAVLYRLSFEALQRLTREAPELAAAFHEFVARLLAQRIVDSTAAVKSLFN
ncbi:SulP family inorganic anion transporter [Chondromyces apiculatus]|uniref:Sulfate transporter family protein n=1 Tax=Chondromyces apiculatus DSM 436 TaxID=1192034 RepID=A0A017TBC1_9BACT|nr:SulP family inorganic anion transporter [Chondromyces apiculatus]EYF05926.1 Sulfate transporter family protein [Chondromyces apiculatus DSM 436]